MLQQPPLPVQSAAIFDQRTVGPDQAMTGHDDAKRVGAVGMPDGAHRFGHAEFRRQTAVAHGDAGWNFGKRGPYLALERSSGDTPADFTEAIEVALEIACQRG